MPCRRVSLLFPFHCISVQPPLEHRNRVCGIRRPRLRHVPMLNKACALHPINVRQRNWLLARLIHTHVDEANVVIEAVTEDYGRHKRNDCRDTRSQPFRAVRRATAYPQIFQARQIGCRICSLTVRQFLLVRNPALSIKGIMLGQVESDVLVERANDVLFDIELVDEAVEDLPLDVFGRRVPGAVAGVGADFGVGAGVEAWCSEGEEGGEGREGCEEGRGTHCGWWGGVALGRGGRGVEWICGLWKC